MKFGKRSKIIAAAMAMMTLSTAAAVTGTVAWFVAANEVSVQGFQMTAEAENGIVIANESHSAAEDWKTEVSASHTGAGLSYVPISTADCSTWYHANAATADSATKNNDAYESILSASDVEFTTNAGVAKVTKTCKITGKNAYLVNSFYIQAAAQANISGQDIYITNLTASSTTSNSTNLNKCLRLAVVYNNTPVIFGVIPTWTTSYKVGGSDTNTTANDASGSNKIDVATNVTIPAYTVNASTLKFDVYCYFEGEDANCKSTNIAATMDALDISFKFGNENTSA